MRRIALFVISSKASCCHGIDDEIPMTKFESLGLYDRRGGVFSGADVDSAPQFGVAPAVKEIDREPKRQPNKETAPSFQRQTQQQHEAKENAEKREQWHERDPKWARTIGVFAPQNNHAKTNEHEGKQRSDVREIGQR